MKKVHHSLATTCFFGVGYANVEKHWQTCKQSSPSGWVGWVSWYQGKGLVKASVRPQLLLTVCYEKMSVTSDENISVTRSPSKVADLL